MTRSLCLLLALSACGEPTSNVGTVDAARTADAALVPDAGPPPPCGNLDFVPTGSHASVAIAPDGTLFLSAGNIARARPPYGAIESNWLSGVQADDMAIAPDGTLWYRSGGAVGQKSLFRARIDAAPGTPSVKIVDRVFDYGLDVADDGTVFFVEHRIVGTSDSYVVRRIVRGQGAPEDVATFDFFIGDLAVDRTDGSLLVLSYFGSAGLFRVTLDPTGHEVARAEILPRPMGSSRQGVTSLGDGRILYTFSVGARVIDPVAGTDVDLGTTGPGFNLATGIARGRGALRCDVLLVAANPSRRLTLPSR